MANRPERVKSLIGRYIADIVRNEIRKPGLGIVCVNEVVVANDYSYADVYVTFLDGKYSHQKIEELKKTEGFVRSSLAKKIDIYKVPKVRFVLDETALSAARVEAAVAKEEKDLAALETKKEAE